MGVPQDIVHLLQGGNQNLPELAENLGLPVFPLGIQFFGHGLKLLLHLNLIQERCERRNLVP